MTENRIFKQRNVDIGIVSLEEAQAYGASPASWCAARAGPGTCAGRNPTNCYNEFDFRIPIGKHGDCYDRYLCRMEEMRESLKIMRQALEKMDKCPGEPVMTRITRSRRRAGPT